MESKQMIIVFLVCCVTYALGSYTECKETGKINSVKVNNQVLDPKSKTVAQLAKGKNASLEIEFKTAKVSKTAESKCYGVIDGVSVPFPVEQNGCLSMSSASCQGAKCCPMAANNVYTFKTQIFVKEIYPSIRLAILWKEMGDDGQPMFCLALAAQIVN